MGPRLLQPRAAPDRSRSSRRRSRTRFSTRGLRSAASRRMEVGVGRLRRAEFAMGDMAPRTWCALCPPAFSGRPDPLGASRCCLTTETATGTRMPSSSTNRLVVAYSPWRRCSRARDIDRGSRRDLSSITGDGGSLHRTDSLDARQLLDARGRKRRHRAEAACEPPAHGPARAFDPERGDWWTFQGVHHPAQGWGISVIDSGEFRRSVARRPSAALGCLLPSPHGPPGRWP